MRVFEHMFRTMGRATGRVLRREPWWAEFWSAVTAIGWSAVSLSNNGAMDVWPSMQVLLLIGGENFWHGTGLGLGLAQLGFLLLDCRWLRWSAAVAMCWFWAVLTLGIWAAVPGSPGVAVYAGWCATNLFSILRLVRPTPAWGGSGRVFGGPHG